MRCSTKAAWYLSSPPRYSLSRGMPRRRRRRRRLPAAALQTAPDKAGSDTTRPSIWWSITPAATATAAGPNPAAFGWLDGVRSHVLDVQEFRIGPFTGPAQRI